MTEVTVTLAYKDGKIEKTEDRLFSNPVRNNSDGKWSQIYCVEETEDKITYRYRTGQKINDKDTLILCWQAKQDILSETDYANGLLPKCEVAKEKENLNLIKASTMITCKKGAKNISAYLIDEKIYHEEEIKEEDKLYPAVIEE